MRSRGQSGTHQRRTAIELAGSIQPIDRQHISVPLLALGMYPLPETFATTDRAYTGAAIAAPMVPASALVDSAAHGGAVDKFTRRSRRPRCGATGPAARYPGRRWPFPR